MDRVVEMEVAGYQIRRGGESLGAVGTGNAVMLKIRFDAAWDDLVKSAKFTDARGDGGITTEVELLTRNADGSYTVPVPREAMAYEGMAELSLIGELAENGCVTKRLTTRPLLLRIYASGADREAQNTEPITATDKQQIMAKIDAAEGYARGTADGVPIPERAEDNAKYYKEQASAAAEEAVNQADTALAYRNSAESFASRASQFAEIAEAAQEKATGAQEAAETAGAFAENAQRKAALSEEEARQSAADALESANIAEQRAAEAASYAAETSPLIAEFASGSAISAADSAERPLKGLRLFGKTTQSGTPSPDAPVELVSAGKGGTIEVQVFGKNMIPFPYYDKSKTENGITFTNNGDGSVTINGTATANAAFYFVRGANVIFTVYPGATYTNNFPAGCRVMGYDKDRDVYPVLGSGGSPASPTSVCRINHLYIQVNKDTTLNNFTFFPQLGINASTEYEPFKTQQTLTAQTPNGLPGIPVDSGGNYTDENGQQWICDEIDLARGKYVQRVERKNLDGSESWEHSALENYFMLSHDRLKSKPKAGGLCSHFANKYAPNVIGTFFSGAGAFAFYSSQDNAADWRTWLSENSPALCYALAEPIETDLTAEELAQYAALHANYPNTTVINDGGAGMEVSYVADTKNYIDKKFAELSAAIVAAGTT